MGGVSINSVLTKVAGLFERFVNFASVKSSCKIRSGNLESRLHDAVREAQGAAKSSIDLQKAKLLHEFSEILEGAGFNAVYQPIVSFQSGCVLGWEALARGPLDSYFHSPDVIFSFAEEVNLLYPVEKLCRRIAINQLGGLEADQKLFLNIHPRSLGDPNFVNGETIKLIKEMGLNPGNVVFEITERHCIDDFSYFNKTLEYYRGQGFLVAVDDAGAGFSCLQSIAEIRPDFIKIDMSLVRGVHNNRVKRALLETFTTFAEKISCSIIAEGIEEEEELNTLASMGVHYGQGFFIGKPAYPKALISDDVLVRIIRLASNNRNRIWKPAFPVGSIAENAVSVDKNTLVREVKKILDNDELLAGVVIVDEGEPKGLVMRHLLYRHLGMQYGVPLYYERPISVIMDVSPLIVEEDATIELVSQVAMNRDRIKIYDYIIVTKNNLLKGVVSVQNLLDTMTRIRLELARGANPLTGLPGNIAIEQELLKRATESSTFSIVYFDLDNFKIYNDKYGFENGDKVILFTSKLLSSVINKYGSEKDFLGHIGGDDFVLVTDRERTDTLCKRIIKYFDRLIKSYYLPEDRKEGRIPGHDRNGLAKWFPFISVSMAVIECEGGEKADLKTLSEKVAQLKCYAKSIPGSVYVRDRRSRVGFTES
ncbi:EAL domain-containing protein [Pelotomaculum terephthalicicum JT]|uniref:EAL domain-containing protein n=1 Tax=Pelotomaculum terephthalicicum TaxID=206393 RepID=UPI001F03DF89|nr:EAL domain-containing protein [Pelotomaculum terephthalicicum]MCG9969733.1 EAL domain-containing protein [Pelotomaculum terephthalicicum JT]